MYVSECICVVTRVCVHAYVRLWTYCFKIVEHSHGVLCTLLFNQVNKAAVMHTTRTVNTCVHTRLRAHTYLTISVCLGVLDSFGKVGSIARCPCKRANTWQVNEVDGTSSCFVCIYISFLSFHFLFVLN